MSHRALIRTLVLVLPMLFAGKAHAQTLSADVVIYGGTSAGVTAAIQCAEMGKTAILIEPSEHIGGLSSGGLGATDIGNKDAIGGLSREFYRRIKRYYDRPDAWRHEAKSDYKSARQKSGEDTMWTFEPHVAEAVFEGWLAEYGERLTVIKSAKLVRERDALGLENHSIKSIRLTTGVTIVGAVFLDCTYEGDLMALAGVSYTVGREANSLYDETLNGVQTKLATKHQLMPGIDPYVTPGDSQSGLLPGIDPTGPGQEGEADHRVQAYCFRMCNTTHESNRLPFVKPAEYDELQYELLFRNFEAGRAVAPWHAIAMPNRKTDTNNNRGFSTDYIGASYSWAEASYAQRKVIYNEHLRYQQGLMWTLANHPRVPAKIRDYYSKWGNCRDEFVDNAGWPHQLYIREARRMIGEYVVTQHDCQGRRKTDRSIGMAAYTMDSHNVQRYVDASGHVRNEGDVQVGGFPPYPIDFGTILPKKDECKNLLVPVCLSASHIAYGSIRMEPVFMVLGQSAATVACQAIDAELPVQEVDYPALRKRLIAEDQRL